MQILKRGLIGSFRNFKPWIRFPAVLGLLVCSQALWSQQVSVSPSPSYDGSYTVSFEGFPLGCDTSGDVYFCNTLQEQIGNTATWAWNGPQGTTSIDISGKSANTYGYGIWVDWWYYDQMGSYFIGPTWVQVILPLPVPNTYHYQYSGPGNNPQSYILGWNATDADYCDLRLDWFAGVNPYYTETASGLPASYAVQVFKGQSFTNYVWGSVTCYGPGGSAEEGRRLEFNESMSP